MTDLKMLRESWHPYYSLNARGRLIAIDGLDGAGISTQIGLLGRMFQREGNPYHVTKEPSLGPAGAPIRLALSKRLASPDGEGAQRIGIDEHALALLFAADRADHLACEIIPLLRKGVNVITDRFLLSSFAYQGVHVDLDWFFAVNAHFSFPDVTIFLNVTPEVSMRRITAARWNVEKNETHESLSDVYRQFLRSIDLMRKAGARVEIIEDAATADPQTIHQQIAEIVNTVKPSAEVRR